MANNVLTDMPSAEAMVRFREGTGQQFLVTIDTEEEFDWSQSFGRTAHRVDTVARLRKFQQFCEGYGVVPVYLIDYPVAVSDLAGELLRNAVAEGRAEVGVHLHPWANPPYEEEVNQHNSFAGNLPFQLERAKFMKLYNTIIEQFGAAPLIYRAGRYGIGPNTAEILREAGLAIDSSVRSRFNYTGWGGPDFTRLPLRPWWVGKPARLMEMPLTTVYAGLLKKFGDALYPALHHLDRLRGIFARLGLLERIPLTPEGITISEARRAIRIAVDEGLPTIVLSFHSPSLCPGHTPYVRNEADLDNFYEWWRQVFDMLIAHGVKPGCVRTVMQSTELA